jgi:hypothetical protein
MTFSKSFDAAVPEDRMFICLLPVVAMRRAANGRWSCCGGRRLVGALFTVGGSHIGLASAF